MRTDAVVFFLNDTATTEIYTLSLHDALPISPAIRWKASSCTTRRRMRPRKPRNRRRSVLIDRKSTRLNSSHVAISYAVFCLKKKIERVLQRERGVACEDLQEGIIALLEDFAI